MRMFTLLLLATMAANGFAQDPRTPATSQVFEATGVRTVVIRAGNAADGTTIRTDYEVKSITVSATPSGGAIGYHSPDPNWKETNAIDWGMSFVAKRFGDTLVISSKNETQYIHHHYVLQSITVAVPSGINVLLSPRALTGNGSPDLSPP